MVKRHVGNLELLPAIVTHWERTAKPITRPLKVEELCKAFVRYREGKELDKATLSENRYISRRLQKHLGGYMAHELGVAEIRSFLDTAKTSDSLDHKLYKVGSLIRQHVKSIASHCATADLDFARCIISLEKMSKVGY